MISTRAALLFGFCVAGHTACKRERQQPLPEPPASITRMEFTGPDSGWPPQPLGRTDVRQVPWSQAQGDLTDSLARELRRIAEADSRTQAALGQRFAFINVERVEAPKDTAEARPVYRVVFYSHSNNVPVEVLIRDLQVQQVERRPNYDVPESPEEAQMAITLARRSPELRAAVGRLVGSAIVTYPDTSSPLRGHRVLYVTFAAEADSAPRYAAYVDLTEQRVVRTIKEP